jgi:two-component system, response regulator, stage 0 sporulation protein F
MAEPTQVLIVDDDDDVRVMLEIVLEQAGFVVSSACNGQEALERLNGTQPAPVVLLDLRMPVMNGWEMIETLRANGQLRDVPIIVCTSSPAESPAGFEVIAKPVRLEALTRAIKRLR